MDGDGITRHHRRHHRRSPFRAPSCNKLQQSCKLQAATSSNKLRQAPTSCKLQAATSCGELRQAATSSKLPTGGAEAPSPPVPRVLDRVESTCADMFPGGGLAGCQWQPSSEPLVGGQQASRRPESGGGGVGRRWWRQSPAATSPPAQAGRLLELGGRRRKGARGAPSWPPRRGAQPGGGGREKVGENRRTGLSRPERWLGATVESVRGVGQAWAPCIFFFLSRQSTKTFLFLDVFERFCF